jgi:hypothetical protein
LTSTEQVVLPPTGRPWQNALYDDEGRGPAFEPLVLGIHLPVGEEVVLKLHFGDRYIKASYICRLGDRVEGSVKFSKAKPAWWDPP